MCEAGRIKYHLRESLPRGECSILIAGFQAAGTLGRRLVDGARLVRTFGEPVPVRARIYTIGGLSAHADQGRCLPGCAASTSRRGKPSSSTARRRRRPISRRLSATSWAG
jgi:Cft2 family RNA processing exonuclease